MFSEIGRGQGCGCSAEQLLNHPPPSPVSTRETLRCLGGVAPPSMRNNAAKVALKWSSRARRKQKKGAPGLKTAAVGHSEVTQDADGSSVSVGRHWTDVHEQTQEAFLHPPSRLMKQHLTNAVVSGVLEL